MRRLLPARDDALPLYIQEQGVSLGKSGEVLTVSRKGETFRKVKLIDVSQVSVFGSVQITAQALRRDNQCRNSSLSFFLRWLVFRHDSRYVP